MEILLLRIVSKEHQAAVGDGGELLVLRECVKVDYHFKPQAMQQMRGSEVRIPLPTDDFHKVCDIVSLLIIVDGY